MVCTHKAGGKAKCSVPDEGSDSDSPGHRTAHDLTLGK